MLLLDLPDELLGIVLDATDMPAGLRLASKRFAGMPSGKAKLHKLQRQAMRDFGISCCQDKENWLDTELAIVTFSNCLFDRLTVRHRSFIFIRPDVWARKPIRNAFLSYALVDADKVRDHLVAQRRLLRREVDEACRSWYLEIGEFKPLDASLVVEEVQAYVERKMKVRPGDLKRAKELLRKGVGKAVSQLIEDYMRTVLRTGNYSNPRLLHAAWENTP